MEATAADVADRQRPQGACGVGCVPYRHAVVTPRGHLGGLGMPADGVDGTRVALQRAHLLLRSRVEELHFVVVSCCEQTSVNGLEASYF